MEVSYSKNSELYSYQFESQRTKGLYSHYDFIGFHCGWKDVGTRE